MTLRDGITSVEKWAFRGNTSLKSINIPGTVNTIGYAAFYQCTNLSSLTLNEGTTTIDEWAFQSCEYLTTVDIPSSVTKINYSAFADNDRLKTVYIRSTTSLNLGDYCFGGLPALSSVYIYLTNANNFTVNSGAFNKSRTGYLYVKNESMYNKLINANLVGFLGTSSSGHIAYF